MTTKKAKPARCSGCADFGYWKPICSGEQPVCRFGKNFNFKEQRYEDDYAVVCRKYEEAEAAPEGGQEPAAVQTAPVNADAGQGDIEAAQAGKSPERSRP